MKKLEIFNNEFESEKNKKVSISKALRLIDTTPIPDNIEEDFFFIGFVKKSGELIQFVRLLENEWEIDIPIQNLQTKTYTGINYLFDELETQDVKKIVKIFYKGGDLIGPIKDKFVARDDYKEDDARYKVEQDKKFKKWVDTLDD